MSNWQTAKRVVQERIHRFGPSDPDIISRAICKAIRHYSGTNFYFNQASYDFTTVDGVDEYGPESSDGLGDGYPSDMNKPIKISMKVSNTWYEIKPIPIDLYRDLYMTNQYKGFPRHFAWFGKKFLLEPTPNGAYDVKIDYIKNIGEPSAQYDGLVWSYTVDGQSVADTYSNSWLVEGQDLICAKATWYVASQHLQEIGLANAAYEDERQALEELTIDSHTIDYAPDPTPWF